MPSSPDARTRPDPPATGSAPRRALSGERVLAALLRPVVGWILPRYLRRQQRPGLVQRVSAIGPNPLRVLVTGAGLAVGYGTSEASETSFVQLLAAGLTAELGRGVIVESRAHASLRLADTVAVIGRAGAATFDVVIWAPTLEETFRAGSSRWTRRLVDIVRHIEATGRRNVRTVLLGVPPAEGGHVLQRVGASLADDVNRRIEAVADRFDRAEYVPVPGRRIDRWDAPLFDAAYQEAVASALIERLGALQRRAVARVRSTLPETVDRGAWSRGPAQ